MTSEHELQLLDERAARARADLDDLGRAIEPPAWRSGRRGWGAPTILLAAAALVVVVGVALAFATTGDDDPTDVASGDVARYAPTETFGLPLLRAVTGAELGDTDLGQAVFYGADPEFRGAALAVASTPTERRFELDEQGGGRMVDIGGVAGVLVEARGTATVSWQPSDDRLLTVVGKDLEPAQVVEAARSVVDDAPAAELEDPQAFGVDEVVRGSVADLVPNAASVVGGEGSLLVYGREDGNAQRHVTMTVIRGEQVMVDALRVIYPDAREVDVHGGSGLLAFPPSADGEGAPDFWIVAWRTDGGAVVRLALFGFTEAEALTVARSVEPISPEEFERMAANDGFEPGLEGLPGLEVGEIEVATGVLQDETRWRVSAADPSTDAPVEVTFTEVDGGSSSGTGIGGGADDVPQILIGRSDTTPGVLYGFARADVDTLRWESPTGLGDDIQLVDFGDERGQYFAQPSPGMGTGPVTIVGTWPDGDEAFRLELAAGESASTGTEATTTSVAGG